MQRKASDDDLIRAYRRNPSAVELAIQFGMSERAVHARLANLRGRGVKLSSPDPRSPFYAPGVWGDIKQSIERGAARIDVRMPEGTILVGSDAHYWPGIITVAHRAFVRAIRELRPRLVVMNGDIFDGATISRWPRIGWDKRPTVLDELRAAQERLTEIEDAAGSAELYWPLGNHDARFENRLAQAAPEYEGVKFFSLKDHFPKWRPCWSVMVNENLLIKHRWKGGRYAPANNTLHAGVSYCTGHLHSLKWWPHTDETGTRYGIDCGTLAEPAGPQFVDYTEDSPKDWRSGFAVLTVRKGKLMTPEFVQVEDGEAQFRGAVIDV